MFHVAPALRVLLILFSRNKSSVGLGSSLRAPPTSALLLKPPPSHSPWPCRVLRPEGEVAGHRISVKEKKGLAVMWPWESHLSLTCKGATPSSPPDPSVLTIRWTCQGWLLRLMLVLPLGKATAKDYSAGHVGRHGEARASPEPQPSQP